MPDVDLRSIELLETTLLFYTRPKYAQAIKEKTMPHRWESHESDRTARCAICDGKFGLVRRYSWRTALCSAKCVDRFRARRQNDRNWMGWLQITVDQSPENRARVS
jgi:hypothetical protein